MKDVHLQPIMDMMGKLGIGKIAAAADETQPITDISTSELADELGKLAVSMPMPEEIAGQQMHDEKTPLDNPEGSPAAPVIENNMDSAHREDTKKEDNLDSLTQTPAPLGDPSSLNTNQDPMSIMASKIASSIEPMLTSADKALEYPAMMLNEQIGKTAAPLLQGIRRWVGNNPEKAVAAGVAGGTAIGGGLGFLGGKQVERHKDKTEDQAILQLGAEIGGRMAANHIIEQLSQATQQSPEAAKEG